MNSISKPGQPIQGQAPYLSLDSMSSSLSKVTQDFNSPTHWSYQNQTPSSNLLSTSGTHTNGSITKTFQIRELRSTPGRRNLTVKNFVPDKRSAPVETSEINLRKKSNKRHKQNNLDVSHEPLFIQPLFEGHRLDVPQPAPATRHKSKFPTSYASIKPDAPLQSLHYSTQPISTPLQSEHSLPQGLMPLYDINTSIFAPQLPIIQPTIQPTIQPPVALTPTKPLSHRQPNFQSIPGRHLSRQLPSLPGLDPIIRVDFRRKYGPTESRDQKAFLPEQIEARFTYKPASSLPTEHQLPGPLSVLQPSKIYSPITEEYEMKMKIYFIPLRLPNTQVHHDRRLGSSDIRLAPLNLGNQRGCKWKWFSDSDIERR